MSLKDLQNLSSADRTGRGAVLKVRCARGDGRVRAHGREEDTNRGSGVPREAGVDERV